MSIVSLRQFLDAKSNEILRQFLDAKSIVSIRRFIDLSLERIHTWSCSAEQWTARLLHRKVPSPEAGPLTKGESLPGGWAGEFSYDYHSLHCQVRVSVCEPTPGLQRIYAALAGQDEA